MNLSGFQMRQLWRLLGLLDVHLGSAIESSLIHETGEPGPEDERTVKQDRRDLLKVREYRKILYYNDPRRVRKTRPGRALTTSTKPRKPTEAKAKS